MPPFRSGLLKRKSSIKESNSSDSEKVPDQVSTNILLSSIDL